MQIHSHGTGSKQALLIHGMASTSVSWRNLIEDLVNLNFTVLTPDLPGHGTAARGSGASFYSVEKWSSMLTEGIDKVDLLVGHSIGGLLALKVRSQLMASKTVAIDPVLRFPTGPLRRVTQDIWGSRQYTAMKRTHGSVEASLIWDKKAVRALVSPRGIPMPDSSVMVMRPKNSYVSPLALLNKAPDMKVLTLKGVGHNLHGDDYPGFFKELKNFYLN